MTTLNTGAVCFECKHHYARILCKTSLIEFNIIFLHFSVTATRTSNFEYIIKMNGRCVPVEYRELRNGTLLLKYKDRSHPCYIDEESERYKVHVGRMQVNIISLIYSSLESILSIIGIRVKEVLEIRKNLRLLHY